MCYTLEPMSTVSDTDGKAEPRGHRWEASDALERRFITKGSALLVYSFNQGQAGKGTSKCEV